MRICCTQAKSDEELAKNIKGIDQDALAQALAKALAEEAAAAMGAAGSTTDGLTALDEKPDVSEAKADQDGREDGPTSHANKGGVKLEEGGMKVEEELGLKRPAQRDDCGGGEASTSEASKRARLTVEASPQIYHLDDDALEGVGTSCRILEEHY